MYNIRNFILCGSLILSLTVSMSALSHGEAKADLELIRVPGDYPSIQAAINAASVGSMIMVDSGVYHEHVIVNKTVKLVGSDRMSTIIDGDKNGTAFFVTADDVLISGFTVQNCSHRTAHWAYGSIHLVQSRLATISGNIITRNKCNGIVLDYSDNNEILDNIITFNWGSLDGDLAGGQGIILVYSNWNTITGNIVAGSVSGGIGLYEYSYANSIQGNVIEDNGWAGVELSSSPLNTFHHNSFFRNEGSVFLIDSSDNVWDDGAEGNYWDDYVGLDDGSNGRVAGDGVGDTDLPHQGVDNYPLVQPPKPIPVLWENNPYPVPVYSNSTVSAFRFVQPDKKIAFNVRGPPNTTGYFKLDIPKTLLSDNPWKVLMNNTDATSEAIITQNQTYTSILYTYNQDSSYDVQIIGTSVIPEFSAQNTLTLILLLTLMLAAILNKRRYDARC